VKLAWVPLFALAVAASAQTQLPTKHIVEDLRIDADRENVPEFRFFLMSPRGEIVAQIYEEGKFLFFDATGRRVGTFGRKGSGPGEFQGANRFGWVADTLWAYDSFQRRVTFISPSFKLIRTEMMPGSISAPATGGRQPGTLYLFYPQAIVGGHFVGTAVISHGMGADGQAITTHRIMSVGRAGSDAQYLVDDVPKPWGTSVSYRPNDGSSYGSAVPFSMVSQLEFSLDGGRFATLTSDMNDKGGSYTLSMFTTRGDTVFRRTYPFAGIPITRSVADSAIKVIESVRGRPPAVSAKLAELTRARLPRVYPPFSAMILGLDGTTWLQTAGPGQRRAVAFDKRGMPLFEVPLPPRTRVWQANLTTLWAIQKDDDDVGSIVRYRIR
jgi:hypothetical protein